MPEDTVHLVLHCEEPHGYFVTSVQLPGFVYGAATRDLALRGLAAALEREDVTAPVELHQEEWHVSPNGVASRVRFALDDAPGRQTVREWLHDQLDVDFDFDWFVAEPSTETFLFICAVDDDKVSWIREQLPDSGSAAAFALVEGDGLVYRTLITGDVPTDLPTVHGEEFSRMTARELIDTAATYETKTGRLLSGPRNAAMFTHAEGFTAGKYARPAALVF